MKIGYKFVISQQKWVSEETLTSALPNKLDFITVDLKNYEVIFDRSLIDDKGARLEYAGDYTVQIRAGYDLNCCSTEPQDTQIFTYTVVKNTKTCNPKIEVALEQDSYTYTQDSKPLEIVLDQMTNGDCRFSLSAKDVSTGRDLDPEIFSIDQPSFEDIEEKNLLKVNITKAGTLRVESFKAEKSGSYQIEIEAADLSGYESVQKAKVVLTVEIKNCISVEASSDQTKKIEYVLNQKKPFELAFQILNPSCQNYNLLVDQKLEDASFVQYEKTQTQVKLSIETDSVKDVGSHFFTFVQKDLITLKEAVTRVELDIVEDPSLDDNELDQVDWLEVAAKFSEKILARIEALDKDTLNQQELKFTKPLVASVYDLTPTGNLTIFFNRPLFELPPIEIQSATESNQTLANNNSTDLPADRVLQDQKYGKSFLKIEQVMNITVESPFYDPEAE